MSCRAPARPGKGEALWKSLAATSGDIVVFLDADLVRVRPYFVTGLLGPLLLDRWSTWSRAATSDHGPAPPRSPEGGSPN